MRKFKVIISAILLTITMFCIGCSGTKISIDMSELSSYAVQSEVYKMQKSSTAQEYLGKTIKMRAKPYADGDYHYIIGPDGDECCNWEIEIRLSDQLTSYPKTGKNTYVTGEYSYYKEGGKTYYYLSLIDFT